ncbi:unnamed protein product [Meganyctiphanes norvegica]|uniref:Lipoxygenase n=1 Tax=Meganyctiphanes norvegica TaxID=48144 RepID=A0AAV2QXJ4_MEGNR
MSSRLWVIILLVIFSLTMVAALDLRDYNRIAGITPRGRFERKPMFKHRIAMTVKTGDMEEAETDANVWVVLEDTTGVVSEPFVINKVFGRALQRSETSQYSVPIPDNFARVYKLKLFRDHRNSRPDWYCDYIFLRDDRLPSNNRYFYPIDRWIEENQLYEFENYATYLPQFDPNRGPREATLASKRQQYQYTYHLTSAMVKELPREEKFAPAYYRAIRSFLNNVTTSALTKLGTWITANDINVIYNGDFFKPEVVDYWQDDFWFGAQRLQGINPILIKLIKRIPQNFDVTEKTVSGLLGQYTLQQALNNNKIFICDLTILHGVPYKNEMDTNHAAPFALFYLDNKNRLMPVAIQLKAQKGRNNPVYTPKDPRTTWLVAKIYYNNAEAQHHQALSHFGYTHTIMDGIAVASNRHLSPSHPVYKLLKPHFLYNMAINKFGEEVLFQPRGPIEWWSMGQQGLHGLLAKGIPEWSLKRSIGSVENEMSSRGVIDPNILPYYPYRDDALALYRSIKKYVTTILAHYYDNPSKLSDDWELKNWRDELSKPRRSNGVGIPDVPGTSNGFRNVKEVIELVTDIIATSSMGHAAVNFQQYDQYSFQLNYPAVLKRPPPTQKREYTRNEIMQMLANKREYLSIMATLRILSWQGTNDLGDFEKRYLYDPVSLQAERQFQQDLRVLSANINQLNRQRQYPYRYMDPELVPNAISI